MVKLFAAVLVLFLMAGFISSIPTTFKTEKQNADKQLLKLSEDLLY